MYLSFFLQSTKLKINFSKHIRVKTFKIQNKTLVHVPKTDNHYIWIFLLLLCCYRCDFWLIVAIRSDGRRRTGLYSLRTCIHTNCNKTRWWTVKHTILKNIVFCRNSYLQNEKNKKILQSTKHWLLIEMHTYRKHFFVFPRFISEIYLSKAWLIIHIKNYSAKDAIYYPRKADTTKLNTTFTHTTSTKLYVKKSCFLVQWHGFHSVIETLICNSYSSNLLLMRMKKLLHTYRKQSTKIVVSKFLVLIIMRSIATYAVRYSLQMFFSFFFFVDYHTSSR